jgi:hypothetical protein
MVTDYDQRSETEPSSAFDNLAAAKDLDNRIFHRLLLQLPCSNCFFGQLFSPKLSSKHLPTKQQAIN